jgi:hypothetical protein
LQTNGLVIDYWILDGFWGLGIAQFFKGYTIDLIPQTSKCHRYWALSFKVDKLSQFY